MKIVEEPNKLIRVKIFDEGKGQFRLVPQSYKGDGQIANDGKGNLTFRGSDEGFAKFLRKIQAKDNATDPPSSKGRTYMQMVKSAKNKTDPYIWVWNKFWFKSNKIIMESTMKVGDKGYIKKGYGYWDTSDYPIGGKFARASEDIPFTVEEVFSPAFHGATIKAITDNGDNVAFGRDVVREGENKVKTKKDKIEEYVSNIIDTIMDFAHDNQIDNFDLAEGISYFIYDFNDTDRGIQALRFFVDQTLEYIPSRLSTFHYEDLSYPGQMVYDELITIFGYEHYQESNRVKEDKWSSSVKNAVKAALDNNKVRNPQDLKDVLDKIIAVLRDNGYELEANTMADNIGKMPSNVDVNFILNGIAKKFGINSFAESVIELQDNMKIPGTDIILEKGDKIKIIKEAGVALQCQECGKTFNRAKPTSETKCPSCGSYDIDIDYSKKIKEANKTRVKKEGNFWVVSIYSEVTKKWISVGEHKTEKEAMEDAKHPNWQEAESKTAKCPDCGGKYLIATGYCVACKKKVGGKKKDSDDKKKKESYDSFSYMAYIPKRQVDAFKRELTGKLGGLGWDEFGEEEHFDDIIFRFTRQDYMDNKELIDRYATEVESMFENINKETIAPSTSHGYTKDGKIMFMGSKALALKAMKKAKKENPDAKYQLANTMGKKMGDMMKEEVMTMCPECGKEYPTDLGYCEACKNPMHEDVMIQCPECGYQNGATAEKCEHCGADLPKFQESIEVTEDFKIPGTDVIIEKGDKILILNERIQTDTITYYTNAASALVNNDWSGLNDEAAKEADEFMNYLKSYFGPRAQIANVGDNYFGRPDFPTNALEGDIAEYTITY